MSISDQYKRQINHDLAQGNVESLDTPENGVNYENFDDFAQRSSREERRQLFGRNLHPNKIPTQQMEPELQKAIAQISPGERGNVAHEFIKQLEHHGLKGRDLERQLGLSTHHTNRMNADDVSKLAAFTYHNHPHIFQEVMADQPAILKFLSNPVVGAVMGAIAAKWLHGRK